MLIVQTQHPTPYYDDSYGVNSANMGPYGDALTKEFYPFLEQKFRAIGESWARVLYGGSTGGWMSLAQQVFYPEFFGGTWSFCPDPVDFHMFQTIDVYRDPNAYYDVGPFARVPSR
jgi:enterochelin esterase-like enzyme